MILGSRVASVLIIWCLSILHAHAISFITVGDSLTAGLFRSSGYIYCPPTDQVFTSNGEATCSGRGVKRLGGYQPQLSKALNADVYNYGISGAKSGQIVGVTNSVAQKTIDYIVVMAGTNDVISEQNIEVTLSNIETMVEIINAHGKVPIVLTVPPLLYSSYSRFNEQVIELNLRLVSDIGKIANVIDVYDLLEPAWGRNNSGDGIHLGDEGNRIIGQAIVQNYQNPPKQNLAKSLAPALNLLLNE